MELNDFFRNFKSTGCIHEFILALFALHIAKCNDVFCIEKAKFESHACEF